MHTHTHTHTQVFYYTGGQTTTKKFYPSIVTIFSQKDGVLTSKKLQRALSDSKNFFFFFTLIVFSIMKTHFPQLDTDQ